MALPSFLQDLLRQLRSGDVITGARIVDGVDNLVE